MPEWEQIHRELKRKKSVTLQLLWYEYKQANPDGIQYSQFCAHYREWVRKLDIVMRLMHRAGAKMFVDFAGETMPIVDPASGETDHAHVYVAVLGASNKASQKINGTCRSLCEQIDRPALKPLPETRYVFAGWRKATANIDYHIAVDHNLYSIHLLGSKGSRLISPLSGILRPSTCC